MKTRIIIGLLIVGTFVVSCQSNTYEEISGVIPNPTYNVNVKPVMATYCISCHNPEYGQEPYLETYAEVKESTENGTLLQQIGAPSGQGMPQSGKMPQNTIDLINRWAANGYIE